MLNTMGINAVDSIIDSSHTYWGSYKYLAICWNYLVPLGTSGCVNNAPKVKILLAIYNQQETKVFHKMSRILRDYTLNAVLFNIK